MSLDSLPEAWTVWNAESGGRVILAYRPDVFDGDRFPAACLPTIYVTNGSRSRRPGAGQYQTDTWQVVLYLEPEIEALAEEFDDRDAAVAGAVDVAGRFADGAVDYRSVYQVPREAYLDRLDEFTGRDA